MNQNSALADNLPLVSVRVCTYNSSKYILDTLNSVFRQTYPKIELIISDDCSTDNTVGICKAWVDRHSDRFVRVELLEVPKNTGTSANVNRANSATRGEWIKGLAGDDMLADHAIETFVDYVTRHDQCRICISGIDFIDDDGNPTSYDSLVLQNYLNYLTEPLKKQQRRILQGLFMPSPPAFMAAELAKNRACDENFPFADEWPFFYKVLNEGNRIYPVTDILFHYRVREGSLSRINGGLDPRVVESMKNFAFRVIRPQMLRKGMLLSAWHITLVYNIQYWQSRNRYGSVASKLMKLGLLLSPVTYCRIAERIRLKYVISAKSKDIPIKERAE